MLKLTASDLPTDAYEISHIYRPQQAMQARVSPVKLTHLLPSGYVAGIDHTGNDFYADLNCFYKTLADAQEAARQDLLKDKV